jgi:hypothetical protein
VPYGSYNFAVRISGTGRGRGRGDALGFSEVVLPPLVVDDRGGDAPPRLVLRRGHTGSLELYEWWRRESDPKRRRPAEVVVDLLDDATRPVTRWRFSGCRLVSVSFSPLDALVSRPLIETAEIAYESVEMSSVDDLPSGR